MYHNRDCDGPVATCGLGLGQRYARRSRVVSRLTPSNQAYDFLSRRGRPQSSRYLCALSPPAPLWSNTHLKKNGDVMKRLIPIPPENVEPLKKAQKKEWGYQFVSVNLKDGRHFDSAIASEGHIIQVKGHKDVPFEPGDVESVVATDKRWNFRRKRFDQPKK